MKATIELTEVTTGIQINTYDYENEESAQNDLDHYTHGGSEYPGAYQWDLIVHHPTSGDLIRRTLYTTN